MSSYLTVSEYRNIKLVSKDATYWDGDCQWREWWLTNSNGDTHIIKVKLDGK